MDVTFDRAKLERLKIAWKHATETGSDLFEFEGDEYLTSYAKYLIEYLETQLSK